MADTAARVRLANAARVRLANAARVRLANAARVRLSQRGRVPVPPRASPPPPQAAMSREVLIPRGRLAPHTRAAVPRLSSVSGGRLLDFHPKGMHQLGRLVLDRLSLGYGGGIVPA